jgi:hypothetical protein
MIEKQYPIYTYVKEETVLFNDEDVQIFIVPYNDKVRLVVNAVTPNGIWREIMSIKSINDGYSLSWYIFGRLEVMTLDDNWSQVRIMLPDNDVLLLKQQFEAYAVANRLAQAK